MLSEYDPHKALKIIGLQKQRHVLKKRLAEENPLEALRALVVFLRPSKFLTYLNILEDFRLHECSWGKGFMEVAGNISLPEEMVVVTRTDLSLKKQAAKGVLEYHESAFSDDVKQIYEIIASACSLLSIFALLSRRVSFIVYNFLFPTNTQC